MEVEVEECGWTTLWWGSVQEEREEVPVVLHLLPRATSIQESKKCKASLLMLLK